MGDYTRDSSNRRTFLKIAALAGVSWAPFLQTNKSPADGAGSFPEKRSLPLLDPKGEVRIGLIGLTGDPGIVMNAIPDIRGARLAAFALADGEQLAEELQYLRKEKVRQSEFSEIQAYPAFHKETRLYHTYQEMLAKEELDVVASCLPSSWNAHVSMAAARQGCHVISEKPLAADLKTLAALESVIRENKIQITAMLDMRLYSGIAAVRKAITGGLIGEPILAFAHNSYNFVNSRPEVFGGTFPWIGIQALDCISYTTGMQITQASALQSNKSHATFPGSEDIAGILVKLSNNGTGIVSVDYLRPEAASKGDDRLRVTGTQGVVEMVGERVELIPHDQPPRQLPQPPRRSIFASFVSFLRGQGPHVMTSEEAFRITRVCLIARQAAEQGRVLRTC